MGYRTDNFNQTRHRNYISSGCWVTTRTSLDSPYHLEGTRGERVWLTWRLLTSHWKMIKVIMNYVTRGDTRLENVSTVVSIMKNHNMSHVNFNISSQRLYCSINIISTGKSFIFSIFFSTFWNSYEDVKLLFIDGIDLWSWIFSYKNLYLCHIMSKIPVYVLRAGRKYTNKI